MGNPNKTTRIILRWTHVLVGFLIGVFIYTPARDSETFVLLLQTAVLTVVTLTGLLTAYRNRLLVGLCPKIILMVRAADGVRASGRGEA